MTSRCNNNFLFGITFTTLLLFIIPTFGLLIQRLGIDSNNKATIISGILSLAGGAIGALGAYVVATHQMNSNLAI